MYTGLFSSQDVSKGRAQSDNLVKVNTTSLSINGEEYQTGVGERLSTYKTGLVD